MILRKPYAFLIKHFKLIHLFISILLVYLLNSTNDILTFFKRYSSNSLIEVDASSYINFFTYFAIIIILGLVIAIIALLKKKKKPILFYILTIIGYSILLIGFAYVGSIISTLELKFLERKVINLARDITRFMFIEQLIFLIPYVIRTLGFDIKKFDFKKDLQELEIEVEDNEEFELTVGVDTNKLEQKIRRRLRELKYYYFENKLFINIILVIVASILAFNLVGVIKNSVTLKYSEEKVIKLDNFYTLKVEDSYLTNKDSNGKDITVEDEIYLIVKFTINSNYDGKIILDTNKFIVKIKDETYAPDKRYYTYFKNYGVGYKQQEISLNENKTYILVYAIPEKYQNKKMELQYNYKYDINNKIVKKIIKLSPEVVK